MTGVARLDALLNERPANDTIQVFCNMLSRNFTFTVAVALCTQTTAFSQYDAPSTYYSGATGTGTTLKAQLRTIISSGAIDRSYDSARQALAITDRDPAIPANVILMYNRASVSGAWDGGSTWNREHIWPQSLLGGADDSDLFNLRPANPSINSSRGNKPFGTSSTSANASYGATGGSTYYYPGGPDRGDAARALFYMATRYASNLTLVNGTPAGGQMGDLSSLLKWHYEDTPDTFERRRNHVIFSSAENPSYYQNNRNPYIDRPEYVWSAFGDNANDSRIHVAGYASGESVVVDLGRVMRNAPTPTPRAITLAKQGADPTYFSVTPGANVTSDTTGRYNAFGFGVGSRAINVGLNLGTTTTGLKSGSLTIDNLDITQSGAGTGSLDTDDTVVVQYAVLDKRQVQITSGQIVDFGRSIVDTPLAATVQLGTSGSDHERTRASVAMTSTTDALGTQFAGGSGGLFDSADDTATRTLQARFDSPGNKTGIASLSVQSAETGGAGLGEGSYPSLFVGYRGTVLNHAEPSFSDVPGNRSLSLDFGEMVVGETESISFRVWNSDQASGYVANLRMLGFEISGDDSFGTDLMVLDGADALAAGEWREFSINFSASDVGSFDALLTMSFSDEDIPGGSTLAPMSVVATARVVIPEPAYCGIVVGLLTALIGRPRRRAA